MLQRAASSPSSRQPAPDPEIDSAYSWFRLGVVLLLGTIGGVGLWSVVVTLPAVQAEFGAARSGASLPASAAMLGFGIGGVLMGRLADRFGTALPVALGAIMLGLGYTASAAASSLWQFAAAQGILVGLLGSSAVFGPLIADISHWFRRRRGIAVSIAAAGNYFAGFLWPPIVQHLTVTYGWRQAHLLIGCICALTMLPLALLLRRRRSEHAVVAQTRDPADRIQIVPQPVLLALLIVAGFACCVAMAMPQVHIVAYCGDLGYGVARGTEMLSLMLGCGVISRIASGWIADRIGGVATLLLGGALQGAALILYFFFDSLFSLYLISALFGLFQGGIVPSYAIIVRESFSPQVAGSRIGLVLMATLLGMAFGGWLSGEIFDFSGSYEAAFANGILWNLLNVSISGWLFLQGRRSRHLLSRAA